MNKIVLGIVVGGVLGVFDGLTAWFTPEVRPQILQIIIGSTFKGLVAGLLIGYFARKVDSMSATLVFGVVWRASSPTSSPRRWESTTSR